MMRYLICTLSLLAALALSRPAYAQSDQFAFRVQLTDKAGSPANPSAFLSQRALDRRSRLGITPDSADRPVSPVYLDSLLKLTEGKLHVSSRWLNQCVILLTDSSKILNLQGVDFVSSATWIAFFQGGLHRPAGPVTISSGLPVRTPVLAKTTGTAAFYGSTFQQTAMVQGDSLHDRGYLGAGKLIAVLDAGFHRLDTHPGFDSLRLQGRLLDMHDFVLANPNPIGHTLHGSQVLSTIAGYWPGTYVGTAPAAQFAIYRTESEGDEQQIEMDNLIAGLERADSLGADIIHASLGYNYFYDPYFFTYNFSQFDGQTTMLARAANMVAARAVLFVTTSGNEGNTSWQRLLTPGDADSAFTVGSVHPGRGAAPSSSYGPNAAGRIKPEVALLGEPASVFNSFGVANAFGTSYAGPQLSGWIACLWAAAPNATPYELKQAIIRSADRYNNPGDQVGYGIPNMARAAELLGISLQDPPAPLPEADSIVLKANPVAGSPELKISLPEDADIAMRILDARGRSVWTGSSRFEAGVHELKLPIQGALQPGHYMLQAHMPSGLQAIRFVIY